MSGPFQSSTSGGFGMSTPVQNRNPGPFVIPWSYKLSQHQPVPAPTDMSKSAGTFGLSSLSFGTTQQGFAQSTFAKPYQMSPYGITAQSQFGTDSTLISSVAYCGPLQGFGRTSSCTNFSSPLQSNVALSPTFGQSNSTALVVGGPFIPSQQPAAAATGFGASRNLLPQSSSNPNIRQLEPLAYDVQNVTNRSKSPGFNLEPPLRQQQPCTSRSLFSFKNSMEQNNDESPFADTIQKSEYILSLSEDKSFEENRWNSYMHRGVPASRVNALSIATTKLVQNLPARALPTSCCGHISPQTSFTQFNNSPCNTFKTPPTTSPCFNFNVNTQPFVKNTEVKPFGFQSPKPVLSTSISTQPTCSFVASAQPFINCPQPVNNQTSFFGFAQQSNVVAQAPQNAPISIIPIQPTQAEQECTYGFQGGDNFFNNWCQPTCVLVPPIHLKPSPQQFPSSETGIREKVANILCPQFIERQILLYQPYFRMTTPKEIETIIHEPPKAISLTYDLSKLYKTESYKRRSKVHPKYLFLDFVPPTSPYVNVVEKKLTGKRLFLNKEGLKSQDELLLEYKRMASPTNIFTESLLNKEYLETLGNERGREEISNGPVESIYCTKQATLSDAENKSTQLSKEEEPGDFTSVEEKTYL